MTTKSNDESLSETSRAVLAALSLGTTLARSILKTQSELLGWDPNALEPSHLQALIPKLLEAVGRFGSKAKVQAIREALKAVETLAGEPVHPVARRPSVGQIPLEPPTSGYRRIAAKVEILGPFARQVQQILSAYSPLAWPLLEAQCERRGHQAADLQPGSLAELILELERSLCRFGPADGAAVVCRSLDQLIRRVG